MTNLEFNFDETESTTEKEIGPFLMRCIKDSKTVERELNIKPYLRLKSGAKKESASEEDYDNIGLVGKCYKDTWFRRTKK